jgi:hypothetical protein
MSSLHCHQLTLLPFCINQEAINQLFNVFVLESFPGKLQNEKMLLYSLHLKTTMLDNPTLAHIHSDFQRNLPVQLPLIEREARSLRHSLQLLDL